ncbi:hypothetical protein [Enterococcus sp. BWR-S5]|uniref:hypothetical protein n=1 Tax=Enterococcus sp. BWR-S5 TaxID=2787714 RepID=UPI0019229DBD|nr:hypothetical protein [Enterococcus sp. BWR-S5]MBL1226647.1 hypothetical protein [Enterococcus sp. BWR-S5]
MKKNLLLGIIFLILLALPIGCSHSKKNVEKEVEGGEMNKNSDTLPVTDFEKLRRHKLTMSKKEQPIENIAKIYFYEIHNLEWKNQVAIDIGNKSGYSNPKATTIGLAPTDFDLQENDLKVIKQILKDSQVESWEESYMFGDKEMLDEMGGEGYNWQLCIQYLDGTSFYKEGKGTEKEEIQPEGYHDFVDGLTEFLASKSLSEYEKIE